MLSHCSRRETAHHGEEDMLAGSRKVTATGTGSRTWFPSKALPPKAVALNLPTLVTP